MNQLLIGIILVMGFLGYTLYIQNENLKAENSAYELRDAEQDAAINQLQGDLELQGAGLQEMNKRNAEIQGEMNRYLDIFKRHNLTKLAAAKPGLIEPRANKATKEVFDGIEEDSRNIDSLDDGVELQPVPGFSGPSGENQVQGRERKEPVCAHPQRIGVGAAAGGDLDCRIISEGGRFHHRSQSVTALHGWSRSDNSQGLSATRRWPGCPSR